jgi:ADP-heptose:LPS heptosyltransferase
MSRTERILSGKKPERWLKRLGLALLRLLAPPVGAPPTASDIEKVQRILVIRPDERIGNAILVTSLLVALKGRFSRAHQSCLISRRYWGLRHHLPSTDTFIAFDKRAVARNPFKLISLVRQLRRGGYDLAFDAAGDHTVSFTHLALTALCGARFRIGHARGAASDFYELAVPIPEGVRHASEAHLDLLRAVTPIKSTARPLLRRPADTGFATRFCASQRIATDRPMVLVHPGARGQKQWPAENFVETIRMVKQETDAVIAMVWGPADVAAAERVLNQAGKTVTAAGILSFDDLISLLRHATVFVSADCGPMHLAAAAETAVVAVFCASPLEEYHTLGAHDRALDGRQSPVTARQMADAVIDVLGTVKARPARTPGPPQSAEHQS